MPGKMTNSILRPPFRPPQVPAALRSSRLSCGKVGKAQIFTSARESSGESRIIASLPAIEANPGTDLRQRALYHSPPPPTVTAM
jgi:hypothetical protein